MKYVILGAFYAEGVGKDSGKKYDYGELHIGVPFQSWDNNNGKGVGRGFDASKLQFNKTPELLAKIESAAFPILADVKMEPSPEDPNKNIALDFDVITSLFDNLHDKGKKAI
ncbi:hypothetical protein [Vibrio tapetis]|uniref:Putative RstB2 protein n=1 Tax=Vibrio tapetis subsp. tapetis TaxID=1671868 RepID=A0A2N8Z9P5_9VIBR|nr:hypothetical protein [Vibrio tapetis]SON48616.1 putative RstB2 protein [Vibrio tapetis subsp. tapetis]